MEIFSKEKNKKKFISFITICLAIFLFSSCESKENKIPNKIPKVSVVINGEKYDTITGEGTWFDRKIGGGNSHIERIDEKFNEISFIEVNQNEKINFDVSYPDNIQETTLYSVDFSQQFWGNRIKVESDIYEFSIPQEKGEYYYSFSIMWDETHNFEYLFKLKVI